MNINNGLIEQIDENLMDVQQCADYLMKTKKAVYEMVHKNKIPYSKLGKKLYFKKSEIKKIMTFYKAY